MLKSIYIRNYALIEETTLDFEKGMTCITGEPGAGKSIILDALGLVLGERANSSVCFDTEKKSVIEATFSFSNEPKDNSLISFFDDNDLDYDNDVCIIRREISSHGKSRCFINDTPVGLNIVKTLGTKLLDIQTQYQKFSLSDAEQQLKYLDVFVNDSNLIADYRQSYDKYISTCNALNDSLKLYEKNSLEHDFNLFLFNELDEANLVDDEYEQLENDIQRLNNSELIKEKLSEALYIISEQEMSNLLHGSRELSSALSSIAQFIDNGEELNQRISSLHIELKDIYSELSQALDTVESDPEKLNLLNERYDLLNTLMKKHKVNSINELITIRERLSDSIAGVSINKDKIESLTKEKAELETTLKDKAEKLTKDRQQAADKLSSLITKELQTLGIKDNTFIISTKTLDRFLPTGNNTVEFLFSANIGVSAGPVFSVASGGELSRIMLALSSLAATKNSIKTIIFDEIDSGISGYTASAVAQKIQSLSKILQVIIITHLPQIAAKAQQQYQVYKESTKTRTFSKVKLLDLDGRVETIASMISGAILNQDAINNARFLLNEGIE